MFWFTFRLTQFFVLARSSSCCPDDCVACDVFYFLNSSHFSVHITWRLLRNSNRSKFRLPFGCNNFPVRNVPRRERKRFWRAILCCADEWKSFLRRQVEKSFLFNYNAILSEEWMKIKIELKNPKIKAFHSFYNKPTTFHAS